MFAEESCVVCMERDAVVIQPECGHKVVCGPCACAMSRTRCAVCRAAILTPMSYSEVKRFCIEDSMYVVKAAKTALALGEEPSNVGRSLDALIPKLHELHREAALLIRMNTSPDRVKFLVERIRSGERHLASCAESAISEALADDDAYALVISYVTTCSPLRMADVLEKLRVDSSAPASRVVECATAALLATEGLDDNVTYTACRVLVRACEPSGDPTLLFEHKTPRALAVASANARAMSAKTALLSVVEIATLSGFVPAQQEGDYRALFALAADMCGAGHSQSVGWRAMDVIVDAIREGAPGRDLFLGSLPPCLIENATWRGCAANTAQRRRLFLELCLLLFQGRARCDEVQLFVHAGGFRALSRCVVETTELRRLGDEVLSACCAGLTQDDREEARFVWGF